jgi:hypothetical protein
MQMVQKGRVVMAWGGVGNHMEASVSQSGLLIKNFLGLVEWLNW